jgi:hypothetical protein
MHVIPGGGHLNSSADFVTFDTLFADILEAGIENKSALMERLL